MLSDWYIRILLRSKGGREVHRVFLRIKRLDSLVHFHQSNERFTGKKTTVSHFSPVDRRLVEFVLFSLQRIDVIILEPRFESSLRFLAQAIRKARSICPLLNIRWRLSSLYPAPPTSVFSHPHYRQPPYQDWHLQFTFYSPLYALLNRLLVKFARILDFIFDFGLFILDFILD